jgi:hypothetical protein
MSSNVTAYDGRRFSKAIAYGVLSLCFYFTLYLFEDEILDITSRGHWYFIAPVIVAFVFSFAHGNFTAEFWDALGIKARK